MIMDFLPQILQHGSANAPWPNLLRPPVPVFMIALFFKLFGVTDTSTVLWSGLFYAGTVALVFWTFEPLLGRTVALVSSLAFAVSRCGLVYARSGLTEPSAMFLLVLTMGLIVRFRGRWATFAAGAALGLCSLSRPAAYAWMIALSVCILIDSDKSVRDRVWRVVLVLGGLLLPVLAAGWLLHWKAGRGLLAINLAYRVGNGSEAMQNPMAFVLHHPAALLQKSVYQIARPLVYFFRFGDVLLFSALAPFGLLLDWKERSHDFAHHFVILAISVMAAGLAFLTEGDAFAGPLRYFDVFTPLLLPWGVLALMKLFGQYPSKLGFVSVLGLFLTGMAVQSVRDPFDSNRRAMLSVYATVQSIVPAKEIVGATGAVVPPAVAWYSDRRSVFLVDPNLDIAELLHNGIAIEWLLASDSDIVPESFVPVKRWPGGVLLLHNQ